MITGSGTAAMEAGIINTLSRGDKVLCGDNGKFGERWVKVARAYGLDVEVIKAEWGQPLDPEAFRSALEADSAKAIKAVILTHSETSTGVINDLESIARHVKAHGTALTLADCVTSLGADQRQTINNAEGGIAGAFGQDTAPRKNRLHQQAPTRRHQGQQIPLQQLTGKTGEANVPLSAKTTHPFSGLQLEHRLGCSDPGHPHPDLKIPRQIKARPWITTADAQGLPWGQRSRRVDRHLQRRLI